MIWRNPLAWLGLFTLAVPLAVHLIARRSPERQRFPTLRFVPATPPLSARWSQLSDLPLLALRLLILAVATAALAGPILNVETPAPVTHRVILVDTSASMGAVRDEARSSAAELAADPASPALVALTARPGSALPGAAAWLETRSGLREIVVYSDFQPGALDPLDLEALPPGIGLDLLRLERPSPEPPFARELHHTRSTTLTEVTPAPGSVLVEWSRIPAERDDPLLILAAQQEEGTLASARRAAEEALAAPIPHPERPTALVLPGYPGRDALLDRITPPIDPWMGEVILALAADPLLRTIDLEATRALLGGAGQAELDGVERLILPAEGPPAWTAALFDAVGRATAALPPPHEMDPRQLDEQLLRSWSRTVNPAAAAPPPLEAGPGAARWLWGGVLLLLLLEAVIRRRAR